MNLSLSNEIASDIPAAADIEMPGAAGEFDIRAMECDDMAMNLDINNDEEQDEGEAQPERHKEEEATEPSRPELDKISCAMDRRSLLETPEYRDGSFSSFAPPRIKPADEFSLKIWAYLIEQREKMLVKASEGGKMEEAGQSDNVTLRLGSVVSVILILPQDTFTVLRFEGTHAVLGAPPLPCNTGTSVWAPSDWEDNSKALPFVVNCNKDASCGSKMCKAWIQEDGVAKAVLEFVLYVAQDGGASTGTVTHQKSAYQKLTALVLHAGNRSFNIFINYRVWANAAIAEKMCYQLLAAKFQVFWDKRNLPDGAPWETCFRIGLRHSEHVVALLSADTLIGMRDNVVCGKQDNVLLEYELALDEAEQNQGFLLVALVGKNRRTDGKLQLWSDTKNEWMTADGSDFPAGAKSVTCGRHTVQETFRRLLAHSTQVELDPANVNAAVQQITSVFGRPPVQVPPPVRCAFTCGVLLGHQCEQLVLEVMGTQLISSVSHKASSFGWCSFMYSAPGRADLDSLYSIEQSESVVVLISRATLTAIAESFHQHANGIGEGVGSDPMLEMIEKAVDRLEMNPTSIVLVTVGEYISVDKAQALLWFGDYGFFSKPEYNVCSATCKTRTVKDTFSQLFQVQGIPLDPKSMNHASARIMDTMRLLGRA